ncbi:MAG: methyltransferase [Burkholderiales bacterium]|nr:methyltransferase [Burkholderiales bacterium]
MPATPAPASVRATLNYTVDNGTPPDYYFYEPDPGTKLNPPGTDRREVTVHDGWAESQRLSADREGFEIHPFVERSATRFDHFDDDDAIKSRFYAQVVAFVQRHTGARRVEVFDHTIRKRLPADLKVQTTVQRPAVLLVHSDYTVASGPQRVRDILPAEAETLLRRRVAFYNVWKPLYRRVEELPLAMCDARTHAEADMLRMDLKYRERTGEIYVMRWNPAHRWVYFPQMEAEQALLLKTYDSETDGRARFMGHSAFEHPDTPPDAPKRESIEVRTMAFF